MVLILWQMVDNDRFDIAVNILISIDIDMYSGTEHTTARSQVNDKYRSYCMQRGH